MTFKYLLKCYFVIKNLLISKINWVARVHGLMACFILHVLKLITLFRICLSSSLQYKPYRGRHYSLGHKCVSRHKCVSSPALVHAAQEKINWWINTPCLRIHLTFGRHENAIEVNSSSKLITVRYGKKHLLSHTNLHLCMPILSQNKVVH